MAVFCPFCRSPERPFGGSAYFLIKAMTHQRRLKAAPRRYKIPSKYSVASLISKSFPVLGAQTHPKYRERLLVLEKETGITVQKLYSVIKSEIEVKVFLDYVQRLEISATPPPKRHLRPGMPMVQIRSLLRHGAPPHVKTALHRWIQETEGPKTPAEIALHRFSDKLSETDRRELQSLLKTKNSWGRLRPGLWRVPKIPGGESRRPFWNNAIVRLVDFLKQQGVSDRRSFILTHQFFCLIFPKVWFDSAEDRILRQRIRSRYRSGKKQRARPVSNSFLRLLPH